MSQLLCHALSPDETLVEQAKFPFPHPDDTCTVGSTDISLLETMLLGPEWKAGHAVRQCETMLLFRGSVVV
jgi:hypothetical protein